MISLNKYNILILIIIALFFNTAIFAQGQSGKSKDTISYRYKELHSNEIHQNLNFKIPLYYSASSMNSLIIENAATDLHNSEIKTTYNEDTFHSTTLNWSFIKPRADSQNMPFIGSLSYKMSGHDYFENKIDTISFTLLTGHTSNSNKHTYGIALTSTGPFKGIPFPIYTYSTKWGEQNVTFGFPYFGLTGAEEYLNNYALIFSLKGITAKLIRKWSSKLESNLSWNYSTDDYELENEKVSKKESLIIEKKSFSLDHIYKITTKISANFSIGREYGRKHFKGENIFKKRSDKLDLISSNYMEAKLAFNFK